MKSGWPDLPYDEWSETRDTLHAHTQVLGKLAARLAPVRLDALWASDLRRARETAEAVALGRSLPVRVDAAINAGIIARAVQLQEPVLTAFPQSGAAIAYRTLAGQLWESPDPSNRVAPSVVTEEKLEA